MWLGLGEILGQGSISWNLSIEDSIRRIILWVFFWRLERFFPWLIAYILCHLSHFYLCNFLYFVSFVSFFFMLSFFFKVKKSRKGSSKKDNQGSNLLNIIKSINHQQGPLISKSLQTQGLNLHLEGSIKTLVRSKKGYSKHSWEPLFIIT